MTRDEKIMEFIRINNELYKRLRRKQASFVETQKKIPPLVDLLVQYGHIDEDQKKQAAAALADHDKTLELFGRLARRSPEALGKGVEKSASQSVRRFVGQRLTNYGETAHGAQFAERIMNNKR